jgi:hypothetical protein
VAVAYYFGMTQGSASLPPWADLVSLVALDSRHVVVAEWRSFSLRHLNE